MRAQTLKTLHLFQQLSPFKLTIIPFLSSVLEHHFTLLLPNFYLQLPLSHTSPNSGTSLHNSSSQSATSAVSSASNNCLKYMGFNLKKHLSYWQISCSLDHYSNRIVWVPKLDIWSYMVVHVVSVTPVSVSKPSVHVSEVVAVAASSSEVTMAWLSNCHGQYSQRRHDGCELNSVREGDINLADQINYIYLHQSD